MISLDGQWRFHSGDDPDGKMGWAEPSFDDSSWALVRSDKTWPEQGLPVASGTFWYRTTVYVPAGTRPLSLYIPSLHISYEVFADGKLVGGAGTMPPHPRPIHTLDAMFTVSRAPSWKAHAVVIAIRAWRYPLWSAVYPYGLEPGIFFGDTRLIQQTFLLSTRELSWNSASTTFLALLEILSGLAALALFYVRSEEKEYLWFGVAMLLSAANDSLSIYRVFHALDVLHFNLVQAFFQYAIFFALVGFYRRLLDSRRDWFYRLVIVSLFVALLINVAGFTPWVLSKPWGFMDFFFTAVFLFTLPFYVWVLIQLIRKATEGRADAFILLLSNALGLLDLYVPFMLYVAKPAFGWNVGTMAWFTRTAQWPFPFSIDNISSFLLMVTMFAILVHRFTRTSLQEEDHKREIEAARVVQQVLIPDAIPIIPGFDIQTAYKPAGQVGGDFFQVLPDRNGGALIVIGDVSGKGMPAAMTVSLLVGTVRTLAHYTRNPGEILAAMNQRMLARSAGGFTTCLVLRADPDGTLTVANAGHISPYLRGKELQVEGGLPLGLTADSTYKESRFHLAKNDQLTVVTDGVVEARGKEGELFGFERTAGISSQPADSVVRTAVAFGQEDDITVVTLVRRAAQELSVIPLAASTAASSPA
ncbi:MAG TPA: SpoIIE family protein phosphatase [Terracidiphilus sp.]|nr:SpoIIE family protein phosphatase [Terracidiphilus sp.]